MTPIDRIRSPRGTFSQREMVSSSADQSRCRQPPQASLKAGSQRGPSRSSASS